MMKNRILIMVFIFVMAGAFTGFAADTWEHSGNEWFCYDKAGNKVCGDWRYYEGTYYYLDPTSGVMVRNSLVETDGLIYYCDETGAKASGWRKVQVANGGDGYEWMYFNPFSGAAQTGEARIRNGEGKAYKKYHFDDNGYMLHGFLGNSWTETANASDALFYYGLRDDGQAYTGWMNIAAGEDPAYQDGKSHWFYFFSGIKLSNVEAKYMDGEAYTFDETGAMVTGWSVGTDTSAALALDNVKYFGGEHSGREKKNAWVYATPFDNTGDEDACWYYVDSPGVENSGIKELSGENYLFDERGKLVSGLVVLNEDETYNREMTEKARDSYEYYLSISNKNKIMYFPEEEEESREEAIEEESREEDIEEEIREEGGEEGWEEVSEEETWEEGWEEVTEAETGNSSDEEAKPKESPAQSEADTKETAEPTKTEITQSDQMAQLKEALIESLRTEPNGYYRKTGNQKVKIDGSEYTVLFTKDGHAFNGVNDPTKPARLYNNGILLTAGEDKVKVVRVNVANAAIIKGNKHYFLVNSSGAVLHISSVKDSAGDWWTVGTDYTIYSCGDENYSEKAAISLKQEGDNFGIFYADKKYWICDCTGVTDAYGEVMYEKVTWRPLLSD